MAEENLHPGVTYFYPTKEVDDEVEIENGHPFRHEMDDIESGVFVGSHGRYYMFVIERIAEYHSDKHRFELVYINKNKNTEIYIGDYEDQIEIPSYDRTEAEHILDLVVEYYRLQELPVPAKDLADCNELLENEKKAGGLPEHWRNLPEVTPPKPAYGTPEFWKQHWAKKKAAAAGAEELGAPAEKVK